MNAKKVELGFKYPKRIKWRWWWWRVVAKGFTKSPFDIDFGLIFGLLPFALRGMRQELMWFVPPRFHEMLCNYYFILIPAGEPVQRTTNILYRNLYLN